MNLPKKSNQGNKNKVVLTFDNAAEKELLDAYNKTDDGSLDQHFASISLQDFYYKYRDVDSKYLEECIRYCYDDLSKLDQINSSYKREEASRIKQMSPYYSKDEIEKMISEIGQFDGYIPAFKRLAIIFEKKKDYERAIKVCDLATIYYSKVGHDAKREFEERKTRLIQKMQL